MKNHGLRFLIIALLVVGCGWAWMQNGIRRGLDLAGGSSLAYQVVTKDATPLATDDLKRVVSVLEKRLNASGLLEINITPTDNQEILIEIPGRDSGQVESIKQLLKRNGELEFRILATETRSREELVNKQAAGGFYPDPTDATWFPYLNGGEALVLMPEKPQLTELAKLKKREAKGEDVAELIRQKENEIAEIQERERFTGDMLAKTGVTRNAEGQIVVSFEFKTERRAAFGAFTSKYKGERMAIILDGKINSAPTIRSRLDGGGIIEGGGGGGFDLKEAQDLSIVLASGATGVEMKELRQESLGPSLGEDAIQRGQISIIAGFLAVLVLMAWFYRMPGMVANLALLLNVVILVGVLAFFRAALSLPGIAGIVLTLGMAVDANILIFERLREERLRGKSLVEALAAGYDRAFVAIVDANATTVLTALVLIGIGSGAVKGFGVTLTVGILASMFTAIFVTRTVFEWGVDKGLIKRFGIGRDRNTPTFDYMRSRKFFTGPTLVLMLIGFAFFLSRDEQDSKDVEFTGGEQVIIQLSKAIPIEDVRGKLETDPRFATAKVITLDSDIAPRTSTGGSRFQITVQTPEADSTGKASDSHERELGDAFVEHVRTVFADLFVPEKFTDFTVTKSTDQVFGVRSIVHLATAPDAESKASFQKALADATSGFSNVKLEPVANDDRALDLSMDSQVDNVVLLEDRIAKAADAAGAGFTLSDPLPARSSLNPSRAQDLWRSAMQAVMLAMLFQVLYIRLRFADYKHGFAAVCALIHDTVIALACVAFFDASGLVHAKINLVLIASFLTLIGYSMNDTIVVFDRIRENLGKGRLVLTGVVNDSINQTLTRSIRTSLTTWVVVVIMFAVNWGSGSVLEGFSFVMLVGVVTGTYSSIFIAAPLLLFLPVFWKKFAANQTIAWVRVVASIVGAIVALQTVGHHAPMWIGVALAVNIPLQFFYELARWLPLQDPDLLLQKEIEHEEDLRPVAKPGI